MTDGAAARRWSKELARPSRAVVCVLPRGEALPILEALRVDKGVATAFLHNARGAAFAGGGRRSGMGREAEKDILTVFAPEERADELFEYLYEKVGIAERPQAFLYMERPAAVTPFALPGHGQGPC
ncbi:MAG: hypothetical protein M0R80_12080 [Proteobacteria bacterium]|jgi:hypothetical protein|nr:hypothetical protein [Pseudomonadota bacterium]